MIVQNGDQLSFQRKESRDVQLCFRRQSLSYSERFSTGLSIPQLPTLVYYSGKMCIETGGTWDRFKKVITSEREARSEFLLIYTKNMSMSGRPAGRGHAFERLISLEP